MSNNTVDRRQKTREETRRPGLHFFVTVVPGGIAPGWEAGGGHGYNLVILVALLGSSEVIYYWTQWARAISQE
jgi:hypothetical protein